MLCIELLITFSSQQDTNFLSKAPKSISVRNEFFAVYFWKTVIAYNASATRKAIEGEKS